MNHATILLGENYSSEIKLEVANDISRISNFRLSTEQVLNAYQELLKRISTRNTGKISSTAYMKTGFFFVIDELLKQGTNGKMFYVNEQIPNYSASSNLTTFNQDTEITYLFEMYVALILALNDYLIHYNIDYLYCYRPTNDSINECSNTSILPDKILGSVNWHYHCSKTLKIYCKLLDYNEFETGDLLLNSTTKLMIENYRHEKYSGKLTKPVYKI